MTAWLACPSKNSMKIVKVYPADAGTLREHKHSVMIKIGQKLD
jgi:hypothetical protein